MRIWSAFLVGGLALATCLGCGGRQTSLLTPAEAARLRPAGAVRLVAVGDLMLGTTVERLLRTLGPDYPYRPVRSLLHGADLTFGNLETPCADCGRPTPGKSPESIRAGRNYLFRAPVSAAAGLATAGFDVVSLANNHAMDYSAPALLQTVKVLRAAGVEPVGAGANLKRARAAAVLERRGVRVAFLGISDILPPLSVASARTPGVAPARGAGFERAMAQSLGEARTRADFVAVSVHWGAEKQTRPNARQRSLGRWLIDHGADLVIGHHPHVLQPVEAYHQGLIHYSLGNFVTYISRTQATEAWEVSLERGKPPTYRRIPLLIRRGQAHPQ